MPLPTEAREGSSGLVACRLSATPPHVSLKMASTTTDGILAVHDDEEVVRSENPQHATMPHCVGPQTPSAIRRLLTAALSG